MRQTRSVLNNCNTIQTIFSGYNCIKTSIGYVQYIIGNMQQIEINSNSKRLGGHTAKLMTSETTLIVLVRRFQLFTTTIRNVQLTEERSVRQIHIPRFKLCHSHHFETNRQMNLETLT